MTETLPPAAPASSSRFDLGGRSLRSHAARGVIINGAFTTGLTFLGFARGFIVAALLTPSQFGIWGILATALITLQWLKQAGIGDKYIQQDEDDQELAFHKAFTLELIVNVALMVALALVIWLLAIAYGQDELLAPGFALVAVLPAMTLQAPLWILYRRLHFARQRALQAIDPVIGFVVTIVLAATGAGYWSLIIGAIAGAWAAGLATLAFSPYRLRLRFDRLTARGYVGFSAPLLIATASGIVIGHVSLLVSESAVGLAAAGAAALAASISILTNRVDEMITATLYPAVCAIRDRTELLYESFVKSNRLALMWAMPFGLSLTLFGPDLVNFALGEKWQPAIELLQVFGAIAAFGHLGFNWAAYFRARGETVPVAIAAVVTAVVFVALVIPLTYAEGLTGLAISITVANAAGFIVRIVYLQRLFPGRPLARLAVRALAPAVPTVGIVLLARAIESGQRTAGTAIVEITAYLVVFAAATWALERDLIREALGYLRGGGAPVPAGA